MDIFGWLTDSTSHVWRNMEFESFTFLSSIVLFTLAFTPSMVNTKNSTLEDSMPLLMKTPPGFPAATDLAKKQEARHKARGKHHQTKQ